MFVGIAAIVLTLAVLVPTLSQDILASSLPNVDLSTRLATAHKGLTMHMIKNDTPGIPLVVSGINETDSTLLVGIDEKNAVTPKSMYQEKIKFLVGDVPVRIVYGHFEHDSCTSKTSPCSPLWAGIQVVSSNDPTGFGTLNLLSVQTLSGKVGFVISGHVAGNGVTGQTIWQPNSPTAVGVVRINPPLNFRTSDSAFVEANPGILMESKIWQASNTAWTVTGKVTSSNTPVTTPVRMMGVVSGLTTGSITMKGVTVKDTTGITYTDQVFANYPTQHGDSGAPIFSTGASSVNFYGINVGRFCPNAQQFCVDSAKFSTYSPWENIMGELTLIG